jgi:hypothetical protein
LKLRKATEYPVDSKDDSDLRKAVKRQPRTALKSRAKKNLEIRIFMGLPDFQTSTSKMVGRVGFEPTTNWLKANCSTN